MDERERGIVIAQKLAQEGISGTMQWWWLSFADGDLPKGQQFLGVALVQGFGLGSASVEAHRRKCNPGGEVMGFPVPAPHEVPPAYQNRLLTKDEALALDAVFAAQKVD